MKFLVVVLGLVAFLIWGCGSGSGGRDTTPVVPSSPNIVSTEPASGSDDVPINTSVNFRFTDEMDLATVSASTVSLKSGSFIVTGTVTGDLSDFIFTPEDWLAPNTEYIFLVSGDVKNTNGLSMQDDFVGSFTTGDSIDTISPSIIATLPEINATGVWTNPDLSATFSEDMDLTSFDASAFRLTAGGVKVTGYSYYSPSDLTISFYPYDEECVYDDQGVCIIGPLYLDPGTTYTATVSGTARDLAGNVMGDDYSWSFTTQALP